MIDDAKQGTPLDLEAIRRHVREDAAYPGRATQEAWVSDALDERAALLAAIDRVQAQCRAWIEEHAAECVRAEQWRIHSGGESWHNQYEDQRDCAEAILAAIKGGAA